MVASKVGVVGKGSEEKQSQLQQPQQQAQSVMNATSTLKQGADENQLQQQAPNGINASNDGLVQQSKSSDVVGSAVATNSTETTKADFKA